MCKINPRVDFAFNLKTGKDLHNQLEIHFIELEKFTRELPDLKKTLDRWIYFLKYADEFTGQNLPVPLKEIDTIEKAARILDKMSLTEEEREIYEARLKSLRDEDGALETARIKGLEEGMEKGKIELARELYEDGYPIEKLAAKFNISVEKMKELLNNRDA
ncbi:MAG: Rpn family recombination-promoting nuclease/putative transposase [Candidatus Eremiobacterota bacterium]